MNKIFTWLTGDLFKSIGGVIDNVFTNDEERQKAKNEILSKIMEKSHDLEKLKSDIIISETKGNFLQRSWRPILMLSFGFIVIYAKFIAPAFDLPSAPLEDKFWDLLHFGIGGYVVGRSAEKIMKDISQNIEFKKNK